MPPNPSSTDERRGAQDGRGAARGREDDGRGAPRTSTSTRSPSSSSSSRWRRGPSDDDRGREVAERTFQPSFFTRRRGGDRAAGQKATTAAAPRRPRPPAGGRSVERPAGRVRAGRRAHAPRGEEKGRRSSPRRARERAAQAGKPPRPDLQTDKRGERRHPLLYMDVNLGPGRTGRIGLHDGDDPAVLAANFARAYGLDGAMQVKLTALVEKYMTEVVPELASGNSVTMHELETPPDAAPPVDVTD